MSNTLDENKMSITDYLIQNTERISLEKENLAESDYCKYIKNSIEKTFGIELNKKEVDLLGQVINGEGQEKDKITRAYSSSLQSFLIFRKVKNNKIKINGITYTDVEFEVENSVIKRRHPSSIDVKLSNEIGDVLFIESKLYEVIRDSSEKGTAEIGASYFSNDDNGYKNKLGLQYSDLEDIGIEFLPEEKVDGKNVYGKESASNIKARIKKNDGKSKVTRIPGNKWVYSYGIKQILSHIIGILNYKKDHKNESIRFAYLYNELPGYEDNDAEKKISEYKKHVQKVFDVLKDKLGNDIDTMIITYQDLYKDNANVDYFEKIGDEVCSYYKLDQ